MYTTQIFTELIQVLVKGSVDLNSLAIKYWDVNSPFESNQDQQLKYISINKFTVIEF